MLRSKISFALLALAVVGTATAFKAFEPPPQVVAIVKTVCKTTPPGPTFKKEVHLKVSSSNLLDYNGQTFYYYFFDDTNTLIEIAQKTVGPNPQIVPVTQLKDGVTYGVEPKAVLIVGGMSGTTWDQYFTAQFECVKKKPLNTSSSSTSTGGAGKQN